MAVNQTECSMFEQRSVFNFLVAEKCKLYEIYGRMYKCKEKQDLVLRKMFTNGLNMRFLRQDKVEKTVHTVETLTLC